MLNSGLLTDHQPGCFPLLPKKLKFLDIFNLIPAELWSQSPSNNHHLSDLSLILSPMTKSGEGGRGESNNVKLISRCYSCEMGGSLSLLIAFLRRKITIVGTLVALAMLKQIKERYAFSLCDWSIFKDIFYLLNLFKHHWGCASCDQIRCQSLLSFKTQVWVLSLTTKVISVAGIKLGLWVP